MLAKPPSISAALASPRPYREPRSIGGQTENEEVRIEIVGIDACVSCASAHLRKQQLCLS